LPRKVLRDLGGRPVLAWVISAARLSGACDEVVVATTTEPDDDEVAGLATCLGARPVRGPVEDVLTRYLLAAHESDADVIVRLTADCPLLDPDMIAACVHAFDPAAVDYVTVDHNSVAHGFDVEVVAAERLRTIDALATGADRSHVLTYIERHGRVRALPFEPPSADLRVTLDEPADADLLDEVVAELGHDARNYRQVVSLLRARPDLAEINRHVAIKPFEAG
jgi:spore coat polysaccharide biosynthesis protein SpsF